MQQEPTVVGCWVGPSWSTTLTINKDDKWPDVALLHGTQEMPAHSRAATSTAAAVRLRLPRRGALLRCENAVGLQIINERTCLPSCAASSLFKGVSRPLAAPLELARHLVWGAVDYAGQLGLGPTPDFALAAGL